MVYRFTMDGVVVNNPMNFRELAPSILRNDLLRVIAPKIDGSFKWTGSGYTALKASFDLGFCSFVELVIEAKYAGGTYGTIFEGRIVVTDCVFTEQRSDGKKWVECQITDTSFAAKIDSNRNIKFNVNTKKAKLGDATTLLPTDQAVDFFVPTDPVGNYTVSNVRAYLVSELLEFLVEAMTNNDMSVSAPIFDTGGEYEGLVVCTGAAIRFAAGGVGASNTWPYLSFEDLWDTLWKQYNVGMRPAGNVLNIEKAVDQFASGTVSTMTNVKDIRISVEHDRLYTNVKLGSKKNQPSETLFSFPDIRFFTHSEEEYFSTGECNHVDVNLDLTTNFITDSNVIEDIIVNDNDEYDDDLFLVETDLPGTARAHKYDTFTPNFVYNEGLVNSAVAQRWDGFIPRSIAYYEGTGDDNFEVRLTNASTDFGAHNSSVGSPITAVDYDLIFSDPNGNYNAGGDYYLVPADGFYRFRVVQILDSITYDDFSAGGLFFRIVIERLDSGGAPYVPAQERILDTTIPFGTSSESIEFQADGFQCFANDQIRVNYEYQALGPGPGEIDFRIFNGRFSSVQVVNGGGIFFYYNLANIIRWVFTRKMSKTEYLALQAAPTDIISVNGVETYLREVKWNSYKQQAEYIVLQNVFS